MNDFLSKLEAFALPIVLHFLDDAVKKIASLTPEQQQAIVDQVNAKIGGNEKFEAATFAVVVQAAKEAVTLLKV